MADYGNESIDSLEGAQRVRVRPAAVLGSDGIAGARHGFTEIVGNAVDEATAGFGDKLEVTYHKDGGMTVRDFGRGVPMGYNVKKEIMNWYLIFNEMYAGGKYEDYQEELRAIKDWSKFDPKDYNYLFSIGLNGLGAASTQYTSSYFNVVSYRDGQATPMNFIEGYPVITLDGEKIVATPDKVRELASKGIDLNVKLFEPESYPTDEANGTSIHWKPDEKVFSDVDVTYEWVKDKCEAVAYSSDVGVVLHNEVTGETTDYGNGTIEDYNLQINKSNLVSDESRTFTDSDLTHGTTRKNKVYVCQADVSLVRTDSSGKTVCFHNAVKMKAGAQYEGVHQALKDFFYRVGIDNDIQIQQADYQGKFGVVVNSYSNIASYKGQTKEEVDDNFIYITVKNMVENLINIEYHKKTGEIADIVEEVISEAEMRIQLQQQAKALRDMNKATRSRKLPEKFIASKNFNARRFDNSELWIVEGDSAKDSVKNARDNAFQAIYAIRGKMTNVLKASLNTIMESKEIREIFSIAGTGMEIKGIEEESFDLSKSRFDKYIIGTDADEDGFQIRVLVFCAFWKLAPQIIENGMLYIAESPKFAIKLKDGSMVYAVRDDEKDELVKEYGGQVVKVERYKGLGQVDAEILAETTVDPETRTMTQIQLDTSDHDLHTVIETVFGKDPFKKRKETLMSVLGSDIVNMFDDNAELINLLDSKEYDEEELEELDKYERIG